ncbi:MAG: hypothetical protein A2741_02895 [Candidatus Zambryskibacteria bacterium RIFCSPHIGHO2_01_FULL_43_27]|uniref:Type-4 uracil-DNA glycosylase n=1 Tax=Candidatus Zambryskibacteria bacterium RIFCSPLOWO2_01_FULL_43_17 TaxID=1802760 RepID=A0A1G2U4C5_9BACT|nr:MAG: hypothetical protein A2741_02895 [Candidatus Zambryskibacteria bacterium RIFCSPHIGHO2_01_FULL_43_27]OHB00763.1 MAG: hypothetical protein A3E93_02955 [Candidatus Zambryskibacteria bacterium RIFCSPHIGHO2_12_FULL_43_12b]OHB04368.1 MAG: hypothetical protein A2920_00495 [Candidatus Zambryskibacteria bacterium RIFCSPLOWO2_01_FULL_43_17]
MQKTDLMKQIRDELLAGTHLPLYSYRKANNYFPVIGEGSHDAKIMFVGEAPGENEAKTGKPFCGRSGKVLDDLLAHIGIPRSEVYVTNIVKDRPQANRDPKPEEIDIYAPFLDRQIEIIKPRVIATLGRFSMVYVMTRLGLEDILKPISVMHGGLFEAKTEWGRVKIAPLYHPAVAVYNAGMLGELKKDFEIINKAVS